MPAIPAVPTAARADALAAAACRRSARIAASPAVRRGILLHARRLRAAAGIGGRAA